jgi:hypothetical protein
MASKTLFTQIRAAYTGDAPLLAALGGMYKTEVPKDVTPSFPYATYHYISGTGDATAAEVLLKDALIQFNIFDDDDDTETLWDANDLLVAVYNSLVVQSAGRAYQFSWQFDREFTVDGITQISVEYRVIDHPA